MSIEEIKKYPTTTKWDALVEQIPEIASFANRSSFGKKQGSDLVIKSYEAGIRDAQRGKFSASR